MIVDEAQHLLLFGRARWSAIRLIQGLIVDVGNEDAVSILARAEWSLRQWVYGTDYL